MYCVLAFSQRSFGASQIHKVGLMTRVLDTVVLFYTESGVIQTQMEARAVGPQHGVPQNNKGSQKYLEAENDRCC